MKHPLKEIEVVFSIQKRYGRYELVKYVSLFTGIYLYKEHIIGDFMPSNRDVIKRDAAYYEATSKTEYMNDDEFADLQAQEYADTEQDFNDKYGICDEDWDWY